MQAEQTATLDITREKERTLAQIAEHQRRTALIQAKTRQVKAEGLRRRSLKVVRLSS
jgi:hypothetical protein